MEIPSSTINWLLEEDNPPVKKRTLVNLLNENQDSPPVRAVSVQINQYPPIKSILEQWEKFWTDECECKHPYKKYQGGYWQIIFLGEMGADGNDARIRQGGEYILSKHTQGGMFYHRDDSKTKFIHCLTANVLKGLFKLGFNHDERVLEGLENIAGKIVEEKGIKCSMLELSLQDDCYMTLPWCLSALTLIPLEKRSDNMKKAIDLCVKMLLDREVYCYVPDKAREWIKRTGQIYPATKSGSAAKQIRSELPEWKKKVTGYVEKDSWTTFGFPLHYNPDALEALLALKAAGVRNVTQVEKALNAVASQMDQGGRWTMGRSLNGKMLADVEAKGKPSKWVTVRALEVLKWWGRV